jgi:hypothetical protein
MTFLSSEVAALALQQAQEPAEVKYLVAVIAAIASIIVAVISAAVSAATLIISRMNQSALQRQQAELTQRNQTDLANLQSQLTLQTQNVLEKAKADLVEKSQVRLESLKADLSAKNQEEIELLRARLGEQEKERNARRDYEYDARKRLYAECEPLLFQLAELAEHAYYRIYSLARTARLGDLPRWLNGDGYYLRSTMHKLISPLVVFRLIQQRLTFVDLTLDLHIASQYRLLKLLYLTFTDAFDLANIAPRIEYRPDVDDWQAKRQQNEAKYWRQGLYLGSLDNSIDGLVVRTPDEKLRLKTYGEFESDFGDKQSDTHKRFQTLADVLHGFHPQTRPVFWRMLWTQSLVYEKILETQTTSIAGSSRAGLSAVSPKLPIRDLDWRKTTNEASKEEALTAPQTVAKGYLIARVPELFGGSATS